MAVNPIPKGYEGAIPYLSIDGAAEAIELYKKAFGAVELRRMPGPAGRIGHAEIQIGQAMIMLADEFPEMGFRGPKALGGTPVMIHIYVPDIDVLAKRAADAGVKVLRPVSDQFYGDRTAGFEDPYGHVWYFATHTVDISEEEMVKRSQEMAKQQQGAC